MEERDDSDYQSRNPDTASTQAYTDYGSQDIPLDTETDESESDDSIDSLEESFLRNFECMQCKVIPSYEQASEVANLWAAGELPGLVKWHLNGQSGPSHLMVFCTECQSFWHSQCYVNMIDNKENFFIITNMMIQLAEGYPLGKFTCQNCNNNLWIITVMINFLLEYCWVDIL